MSNPFNPGDKVATKFMGAEVEVPVVQIYNDEVQVRTPDNILRWRTMRTVWFPLNQVSADHIQPVPESTQPTAEPVPSPAEFLAAEPALAQESEVSIVPSPSHEQPPITTCGQEDAEVLRPKRGKKRRTTRKRG